MGLYHTCMQGNGVKFYLESKERQPNEIAICTFLGESQDPSNKYYLEPNTEDYTIIAKAGSEPQYVFAFTPIPNSSVAKPQAKPGAEL